MTVKYPDSLPSLRFRSVKETGWILQNNRIDRKLKILKAAKKYTCHTTWSLASYSHTHDFLSHEINHEVLSFQNQVDNINR